MGVGDTAKHREFVALHVDLKQVDFPHLSAPQGVAANSTMPHAHNKTQSRMDGMGWIEDTYRPGPWRADRRTDRRTQR